MDNQGHNHGLPVKGYKPQSDEAVRLVNANKIAEEIFLRRMDEMKGADEIDQRWLAIARTNIEQGFMALNRAVFRPERVELDEDNPNDGGETSRG